MSWIQWQHQKALEQQSKNIVMDIVGNFRTLWTTI